MNSKETNHHCSVVEIAGTGVLIEGSSGTGKTSVALGLLEASRNRGLDCAFVCDDQAKLSVAAGKINASAPETISGLVELHGYGITEIEYKPNCTVELVARLVKESDVERMPDPCETDLLGVNLPLLKLPRLHESQSVRIILAWLKDTGRLG
ncbi:MAG: HPr kinase/phosphatase C-terminal domain-containing protein [Pseudomonadota bacterium]